MTAIIDKVRKLLRPVENAEGQDRVRELILQAYAEWEEQGNG